MPKLVWVFKKFSDLSTIPILTRSHPLRGERADEATRDDTRRGGGGSPGRAAEQSEGEGGSPGWCLVYEDQWRVEERRVT